MQEDTLHSSHDKSQGSMAPAAQLSVKQLPSKESASSGSGSGSGEGRSHRRFTSPFVLAAQAPYSVDEDSDSDGRSVSMQSKRVASGSMGLPLSPGEPPIQVKLPC